MRDRGTILWLDPQQLLEDPENVRHERTDVDGLAESIRRYGVLQPLGVSQHGGRWHLIYGTRRRRAAIQAGLETVPCVELTGDRLVCQLLENLQRAELNDMEKAEGIGRLKEQLALQHRDLGETKLDELTATTLGVSPSTVRRYLRLRELPTGVRAMLRAGDLNVTQAQHLFALPEAAAQDQLARAAAERGLSAAALARASGLLVARPGLGVAEAVAAAERGDGATAAQLADRRPGAAPAGPARLAARPKADEGIDEDRELWGDEAITDDDREQAARARGHGREDVATADGHRVFRIRTLDAFCDEVARLSRCVAEGDLARAAQADPKAGVKLDLARRQLQYVYTALEPFAAARSA
jgi:ParB family chromosome partitioning protein